MERAHNSQDQSAPKANAKSQSESRETRGDTARENIARQQETKVSNQRTSAGETSTSKDQTDVRESGRDQARESEVERSKDRVSDMPN